VLVGLKTLALEFDLVEVGRGREAEDAELSIPELA
jgi:hypothetical protein